MIRGRHLGAALALALAAALPMSPASAGWLNFLSGVQGPCTTAEALWRQGYTTMLEKFVREHADEISRCKGDIRLYWAALVEQDAAAARARAAPPPPAPVAVATFPPPVAPAPTTPSPPPAVVNEKTYTYGGVTMRCATVDGKRLCQ